MPSTSSRPPLRPCRCAECRHLWAEAGVCSKMPLSKAPGEKRCGCLYYEGKGAAHVAR